MGVGKRINDQRAENALSAHRQHRVRLTGKQQHRSGGKMCIRDRGYSWVKLIDAIIVSPNPKMALWRKYTNKVFAILMICSAMIYIFLLDEYYSTDQFWAEVIVIVAEIVLGLTVIVFTAAYIWLGYRDLLDKASRHYILTVSILVNFNNLWNNTVVVSVFIHQVDIGCLLYTSIHALFAVLAAICDYMRNIRLFYNQRARTLSDDNGKFLSLCFFFDCFFHSGKVKRIYFHNMFYAAGPGHILSLIHI